MPRKAKYKGGPGPDANARSRVQPQRSPNQPVSVQPTGLPQGERKQLTESAAAVPVPNIGARIQQAIDSVNGQQSGILAGGNLLEAPTASPQEPVTHGLPIGAGAGPEAVPAPAQPLQSHDYEMAKYLPMLETLADQPNASNEIRNYVRLLRGTLPSQVTMQTVVGQGNPGGISR